MRFTGIFGIATLVVVGAMLANLESHPSGATAAANGVVAIERPGLNAVLGKSS